MVAGIFHVGSGLGNMLFRYIATRVLALEKGYDFSMIAPELFKGKDFMKLDMGKQPSLNYHIEMPAGKVVPHFSQMNKWEEKTYYYDPDFNFVEDNTIIDGNFEDERYWGKYLPVIDEWLSVEPIKIPDDVCVIGFRGGEYYTVPDLGLPLQYFQKGIQMMKEINPDMKFEVHTDDPELASRVFPNYKVIHDIGINWRSMRYAKYAIIANSSFYIMPRLLNGGLTIAPRWWNRYNLKRWDYPQGFYKSFKSIHHEM